MHAVLPTQSPTGQAVNRYGVRRMVRGAVVLLAAVSLAGCYSNPDPTEWGKAAKSNFIAGCTQDVKADNGTTSVVKIDNKSHCECVYDAMVNTYSLSWDAMKTYEKKQAEAKPSDTVPKMPSALEKALKKCEPQGPSLATTTTAK